MKTCSLSLLFFLLAVMPVSALSVDDARHLLTRTGFGASPPEIERLLPLERAEAVTLLLDEVERAPRTPAPPWVKEPPHDRREFAELSEETRRDKNREFRRIDRRRFAELQAWWYEEMLVTPTPLTEKLTLFWHNHFATAFQKVRSPQAMYRQNMLLREYALGNFKKLTLEITYDPAMIIYLDTRNNRKNRPNENYARELLELFTMGEGHYTEQDIKEAARAFTGLLVDRRTGEPVWRERLHDDGTKSFLGRAGKYQPVDIIDIVFEQPEVSVYIANELWTEFASPWPDTTTIHRLAQIFRTSGYEIRPVLEALLLSDGFWAEVNRGTLVKSPVELLVGTARTLSVPISEPRTLVNAGRNLEQDVFNPPNVKGWDGGTTWINSTTLMIRRDMLNRMLDDARAVKVKETAPSSRKNRRPAAMAASEPMMAMEPSMDSPEMMADDAAPSRVIATNGSGDGLNRFQPAMKDPEALQAMLLPIAPTRLPAPGSDFEETLSSLLLDPVYQLK